MNEAIAGASDGGDFVVSAAGDSGVLVRYPPEISERRFQQVMGALRSLDLAAASVPGVVDIMPGYASLLVVFDPLILAPAQARTLVRETLARAAVTAAGPAGPSLAGAGALSERRVEIPVLYEPDVAPDLLELCGEKRLTVEEFVAQHSQPLYRCHLLGFRPGFAFLGGLPPRLSTPRLSTPRLRVRAGSVGIAGHQTGIYPSDGPGGWRIVGRTPLPVLDLCRPDPFLIQAGDRVSFVPIDRARFVALGGALAR